MLMVFNKIDRLEDPGKRASLQAEYPESVWISAHTGEGLDDLKGAIYNRIEANRVTLRLQIPQAEGKLLSELHSVGEILSTHYEGNDVFLEVKISSQQAHRLLPNGQYGVKDSAEARENRRTMANS
jgi:GTP-binding protein HflX